MAQHDYDIANQSGAAFRADLNNLASAIATLNSGATAPVVTFPDMLWKDTGTNTLKKRNTGNTGWISLFSFDEVGNTAAVASSMDISALAPITVPATDDALSIYDTSGTATKKITVANFLTIINGLAAEAAPDVADLLPIYDASAATVDKMTLADLLKVVNGLTEDVAPDGAADFVLTYDASAGVAKKVKPANLGTIYNPTGQASSPFMITLTMNSGAAKLALIMGSANTSGAGYVDLAFPVTFLSQPRVVGMVVYPGSGGSDTVVCNAENVTTTGMHIRAFNTGGSARATTVNWLALGPVS